MASFMNIYHILTHMQRPPLPLSEPFKSPPGRITFTIIEIYQKSNYTREGVLKQELVFIYTDFVCR